MTLGNMRAKSVQTLAAWCLGRGFNHYRARGLFYDLEPYPMSALCRMMVGP
jgi:hypothetical protein